MAGKCSRVGANPVYGTYRRHLDRGSNTYMKLAFVHVSQGSLQRMMHIREVVAKD